MKTGRGRSTLMAYEWGMCRDFANVGTPCLAGLLHESFPSISEAAKQQRTQAGQVTACGVERERRGHVRVRQQPRMAFRGCIAMAGSAPRRSHVDCRLNLGGAGAGKREELMSTSGYVHADDDVHAEPA
jgi:hypothetical protein